MQQASAIQPGQTHLGAGVDVTEVCAHSGGGHHVIEAEPTHHGVHLQQQRQWLADASSRACSGTGGEVGVGKHSAWFKLGLEARVLTWHAGW